jgi:leucyl-tRNA synthetase
MPVDLYVGGAEHAVLHLLYARFWHKVFFDLGLVRHPEPFLKLVHQGIILAEDGEKMSKSRGNVVNPDPIVRAHGADVLRLYEMFMGPLEAMKPWQSSQIQGVRRFRDRLHGIALRPLGGVAEVATQRLQHRTVKKVTRDIEGLRFNTAISSMMELLNHLAGLPDPLPRDAMRTLILLVSPFAPHLAEEMWQTGGHDVEGRGTLAYAPWPAWDETLCEDEMVNLAVQINGRLRGRITLSPIASSDEARAAVLGTEAIAAIIGGRTIEKFVYVPSKIVNIVVR